MGVARTAFTCGQTGFYLRPVGSAGSYRESHLFVFFRARSQKGWSLLRGVDLSNTVRAQRQVFQVQAQERRRCP